jgi:hypothetical protein
VEMSGTEAYGGRDRRVSAAVSVGEIWVKRAAPARWPGPGSSTEGAVRQWRGPGRELSS